MDVALTQSVTCAAASIIYIKRDSAETQCAATMERRALLLYALVNYAAAQDNYASLRRAALHGRRALRFRAVALDL